MRRFFCYLCLSFLVSGLVGMTGCSRQHYRVKADQEVYSILNHGNNDSRWKINNPRITPDSASRMFDPFHPDCEPMPTDDPVAHGKMHRVAGMQGAPDWHENGQTQQVDSPCWRQYLLVNENGEIPLDKEQAVELSILHSPEYQAARENLFLAAMRVSQERFNYDVQFYGGDSLLYTASGRLRGNSSTIANDAFLRAQKSLATGGEWIVGLANSITWSLNRGTWEAEGTLLNVSLVQPLLRGASRKVVLERLSQSERDFLAALRQMVMYQQGHYTRIVTGSGRQTIPSGTSGAGNTPTLSGGFYGLLEEQIRIQNQRQNIIGLEENLDRMNELFKAGHVGDLYQVENIKQNLLSSQSELLRQINTYRANVETYIRSLGLPPDLEVNISDPLLEQFQLTSPSLTVLMEDVGELLAMMRKNDQPLAENFREGINDVIQRVEGERVILGQDLEILQKSMPERIASLKSLEIFLASRIASGERIDPRVYDTGEFEDRVVKLQSKEIPQNLSRLQAASTLLHLIGNSEEPLLRQQIRQRSFDPAIQDALDVLKLNETAKVDEDSPHPLGTEKTVNPLKTLQDVFNTEPPQLPSRDTQTTAAALRQKDEYREWVYRVLSRFQYELVVLSLMQTRTRLDSMTIEPISLSPEEAIQTASEHRLDWMNRKAQLVDAWRQMDITADRLKGELNLTLRGDVGTIDRQGLDFSANSSRLQASLEWTSPLTRHTEMMNYRRSQISYQNARRDYYTYVDAVQAELRNILRNIQMSRIDFEINRNAILTDTVRVDLVQLRMEQPPVRGGKIDTNTSEQLVTAHNGLMRSQNNFLNTWVSYQTYRMLLDLNMGTMKLDNRGHWVDPGVIGSTAVAPTELAPAIPVPILETPKLNRRYVE